MKRIVLLLTLLIITVALFAQRGRVTSALSYKEAGELDKAYEAIMEALDPENERASRTLEMPQAWQAKGQILQDIYRKQAKDIVDEPLFKAHDALNKALEYDDRGRMSRQLQVDFTFLQTDLSNYAILAYENQKFDIALECFERFMEISNMDLMKSTPEEVVDTAIIYNAGLAAYRAEDWDKAIKYFKRSAEIEYNAPLSYRFAYEVYQTKGDTLSSLNILKEGFEKYPDDEVLIVELINFYINANNPNAAFEYLDKAIKQNPENVSYYTAKGNTLEKLGREDEAIEVYKKAIEIDPEFFTPYYNLAVIYFNRGVAKLNDASQLPPSATEEYDEMMAQGREQLNEALPYFEKSLEIEPNEIAVMESLRLIYYRLQSEDPAMKENYDKINEKIQKVSQ
jgi:tetratricopeptide (TPR) repeat protein